MVCFPEIMTDSGGVQGGVVLFVWDKTKVWRVKLTRFHRPNMVICEVVDSGKQTPLIGVYLLPYTLEHVLELEKALPQFRDQ